MNLKFIEIEINQTKQQLKMLHDRRDSKLSVKSFSMNPFQNKIQKIEYFKNIENDKILSTISCAMKIHLNLCDLASVVNSYYQLQILIIILTAFIVIVFDCYYILELLYNASESKYIFFNNNIDCKFFDYKVPSDCVS